MRPFDSRESCRFEVTHIFAQAAASYALLLTGYHWLAHLATMMKVVLSMSYLPSTYCHRFCWI